MSLLLVRLSVTCLTALRPLCHPDLGDAAGRIFGVACHRRTTTSRRWFILGRGPALHPGCRPLIPPPAGDGEESTVNDLSEPLLDDGMMQDNEVLMGGGAVEEAQYAQPQGGVTDDAW